MSTSFGDQENHVPSGVSDATWATVIAALVAVRVLIPLAVLATAPAKLPLLPAYDYAPLNGDAYGFYEAVANVFAAFRGVLVGWIGLASLALMISFSSAALILWRGGIRWLAVLLPAFGLSLVVGVLVHDMAAPGAGVVGWPLVWALTLFPLPVFHVPLTPDRAFPPGLALTLIANAATVIATALIGLRATGRRSVGLMAAGLYATWPLWVGIVAGTRAWENGQWLVDVGLHLYAEPVSTALFVVSLALLLHPRLSATSAAVAGVLLGFATVIKLTNGPVAATLVGIVALWCGARRAAIFAFGGIVSAPIVFGFWSNGYVDTSGGGGVDLGALYQLRFVSVNARTSTIFTGTMLLFLLPLAVAGFFIVTGWFERAMVIAPIVVTIVCYSAYYVTNQHPRFYYVILPLVFVLQATGVVGIWECARRRRIRPDVAAGR
jgi:hypothetical protein